MAENQEQPPEENVEPQPAEQGASPKKKMLIWAVVALGMVLAGAAGGYFTGKSILAGPDKASGETPDVEPDDPAPGPDEEYVRHDLQRLTATLNEANARYLVLEITLKMRKKNEDAVTVIESQATDVADWLNQHLSDLRVDEVRGGRNQNRIRREIQDGLNKLLWPGGSGRIHRVLFRKYAIN